MSIGSEKINGLALLAIGSWIWWYTRAFPNLPEGYPGPELFPRLIAIGFILGGLLLIFLPQGDESEEITGTAVPAGNNNRRLGLIRITSGIVLVAIYPFLQQYLGFIPALSIVCFSLAVLLRVRLWIAALTGIGTAMAIHSLFVNFLGVPL